MSAPARASRIAAYIRVRDQLLDARDRVEKALTALDDFADEVGVPYDAEEIAPKVARKVRR